MMAEAFSAEYEKYFLKRHKALYKFRQYRSEKHIRKSLEYGQLFWKTETHKGEPTAISGPYTFRKFRAIGTLKVNKIEFFNPQRWQEENAISYFDMCLVQNILPKAIFTDEDWCLNYYTLMRKTFLADPFWCFTPDNLIAEITDFDIAANIVPGGKVPDSRELSRFPAEQWLKAECVKSEYRNYRKQQRRLEDVKCGESERQANH